MTHTSRNPRTSSPNLLSESATGSVTEATSIRQATKVATASPTVAASPPTFAKFNDTTSYRLFRY
ncbi:hypothetical protein H6G36_06440 [Anabaena minutissima FACHB-250]|nr:hypothetical protein [Anabaena minutissima FACHB-250]